MWGGSGGYPDSDRIERFSARSTQAIGFTGAVGYRAPLFDQRAGHSNTCATTALQFDIARVMIPPYTEQKHRGPIRLERSAAKPDSGVSHASQSIPGCVKASGRVDQEDCNGSMAARIFRNRTGALCVVPDRSVAGFRPETYYVWIETPRGHWELLTQTLIVKGVAIEGDLPEAARFGAWLEQTDSIAEANGTGLWSACAGQL